MDRVLKACAYLSSIGESGAPASFDVTQMMAAAETQLGTQQSKVLELPVTQAVVYGWYDNELGSYTNMLGDRTVSIAEMMQH
jgi:glyceraldehyde 3-phosphate dehydrogenase